MTSTSADQTSGSEPERGTATPNPFFTMPLRPCADKKKWTTTVRYLRETLRSILARDDPDLL